MLKEALIPAPRAGERWGGELAERRIPIAPLIDEIIVSNADGAEHHMLWVPHRPGLIIAEVEDKAYGIATRSAAEISIRGLVRTAQVGVYRLGNSEVVPVTPFTEANYHSEGEGEFIMAHDTHGLYFFPYQSDLRLMAPAGHFDQD